MTAYALVEMAWMGCLITVQRRKAIPLYLPRRGSQADLPGEEARISKDRQSLILFLGAFSLVGYDVEHRG